MKSLKGVGEEAFEVKKREELKIKVLEQREFMVTANENLIQKVDQLDAVNHRIAKQEAEAAFEQSYADSEEYQGQYDGEERGREYHGEGIPQR